jgi:hypothetical protein
MRRTHGTAENLPEKQLFCMTSRQDAAFGRNWRRFRHGPARLLPRHAALQQAVASPPVFAVSSPRAPG